MKQCNQLNPKCEKSSRTSDQFLQQIGEKTERGSGGERKEKMRNYKEKDIFQVKKKKRLKS